MLGDFVCFLLLTSAFLENYFFKIFFHEYNQSLTDWIQIRPDISGLNLHTSGILAAKALVRLCGGSGSPEP